MIKQRWVIDANILGNLCREEGDEKPAYEFLEQVKNHRVLICKEVLKEYRPMSGRGFCKSHKKKYLKEWMIELTRKFGQKTRLENTPELPSCIRKGSKDFHTTPDSFYVRLALSNHDRLLVACEHHFDILRDCIEKNGIRMFNEKDALDFIEEKKYN